MLTATMPTSNGALHWPTDAGPLVLLTVTFTDAEVRLPAASSALALIVCAPSVRVAVFHAYEYGGAVTSPGSLLPSTSNSTLATPTLSDASATIVVMPDTIAPTTGAVSATVGGVTSPVTSAGRISHALRLKRSVVGAASLIAMLVPASGVGLFCRCTQ